MTSADEHPSPETLQERDDDRVIVRKAEEDKPAEDKPKPVAATKPEPRHAAKAVVRGQFFNHPDTVLRVPRACWFDLPQDLEDYNKLLASTAPVSPDPSIELIKTEQHSHAGHTYILIHVHDILYAQDIL